MTFGKSHQPSSWNSKLQKTTSQFAPRPFTVQDQEKSGQPATEEELENQSFQQHKFEATGLEIKEKNSSITLQEQAKLSVLRAKMTDFWANRREKTQKQPNFLARLLNTDGEIPTTEPASIQAKLTLSEPGEQYEQDADKVAPQVVQHKGRAMDEMETQAEAGNAKANPASPLISPRSVAPSVIQRAFAVQVVMVPDENAMSDDDEEMIGELHIGGRPDDLFSSGMGDHTTAWSVITAGVKNTIRHKKVSEAIPEVSRLYDEAKALPGAALANDTQMPTVHKNRYNNAKGVMESQRTVADNVTNPTLQFLQKYIHTYMEYRHAIPLSAAKLGRATGKGESKHIASLNDYTHKLNTKVALSDDDRAKKRMAMWELLDAQSLGSLFSVIPIPSASGKAEMMGADLLEAETRIVQIMQQHLLTLKSSFPAAYQDSQIASEASVKAFLTKHAAKMLFLPIDQAVKALGGTGVLTAKNPTISSDESSPAKDRLKSRKTQEQEGQNTFAVQVEIGDNNKINSINTGSRPENLFSGGMGDHTTAWGVVAQGVQNALMGKTIAQAIAQIERLYDEAQQLPGVKLLAKPLSESESGSKMEEDGQTPQISDGHLERYDQAKDIIDDLHEARNDKANQTLDFVQQYARAYLIYRHHIPLSAFKLGVAAGKAEAVPLGNLQSFLGLAKTGRKLDSQECSQVRVNMWDLLDATSMAQVAEEDADDTLDAESAELVKHETMGAVSLESMEARLTAVIEQHLLSLKSAFPELYPVSKIDSSEAVKIFVGRMGYIDQVTNKVVKLLQGRGVLSEAKLGSISVTERLPIDVERKKRKLKTQLESETLPKGKRKKTQ